MSKILKVYLIWQVIVGFSRAEIPGCAFHDTIEIDPSSKQLDGTYLEQGVVIPANFTAIYNYLENRDGEREPIDSHLRACICKLKSCVRLCCPHGHTKPNNAWECEELVKLDDNMPTELKITLNNGSQVVMEPKDEFIYQTEIPCYTTTPLLPHENDDDEWELFENGTVSLTSLKETINQVDYCLNPHHYSKKHAGKDVYILTPYHCRESKPNRLFVLKNICMAISVPFLLFTIAVYMLVPKLRNLHGKCLISYLSALAIAYTCLVTLNFNPQISDIPCRVLGYLTYFSFISAFSWLSVISYDLWQNLIKRNYSPSSKILYLYLCIGWGVGAVLTCIAIWMQYFANVEDAWRPGIGSEDYCWLPTSDTWTPMGYFYGPMLIFMCFNLTIFALIAHYIWKIRKEMQHRFQNIDDAAHQMAHRRQRKFNEIKDAIFVFLRIFLLMGLTWLLEVGSFLVAHHSTYAKFFIPADFLNAAQGIIIFIILVCNHRVVTLIKDCLKDGSQMKGSTNTNSDSDGDNEGPDDFNMQQILR